jgi:hypothetical protein
MSPRPPVSQSVTPCTGPATIVPASTQASTARAGDANPRSGASPWVRRRCSHAPTTASAAISTPWAGATIPNARAPGSSPAETHPGRGHSA